MYTLGLIIRYENITTDMMRVVVIDVQDVGPYAHLRGVVRFLKEIVKEIIVFSYLNYKVSISYWCILMLFMSLNMYNRLEHKGEEDVNESLL